MTIVTLKINFRGTNNNETLNKVSLAKVKLNPASSLICVKAFVGSRVH